MIPIKYNTKGMSPLYVQFYSAFKAKIEVWVHKEKISSKNKLDPEAKSFFKYLTEDDHLEKLMSIKADDIPAKIKELKNDYPGLMRQNSNIMRMCRVIFITHGYESNINTDKYSFPKDELIDDVAISVCPYCNRTFIHHVTRKKNNPDGSVKNVDVKAQLDHFYDKSKYPYLAVSRENLVPCCSFCNGLGGKHTDDVEETHLVNPYTLKDSEGIKFKIDDGGSGLLNMKQLEADLRIDIDTTNNPAMKQNVETFNLDRLYECHKDYAAEMYKIHLFRQTDAYKKFIQTLVGDDSVGVNTDDINRIIAGTFSNVEDYNKRPLSKFKNDILQDLRK